MVDTKTKTIENGTTDNKTNKNVVTKEELKAIKGSGHNKIAGLNAGGESIESRIKLGNESTKPSHHIVERATRGFAPAADDVRNVVRKMKTIPKLKEQITPPIAPPPQTISTQPTWQTSWSGIWSKITTQFRAEFGETSYRRFLASLVGHKYQDGVFTFRAENFFQAEWVKKNYRYWLLQRFQIEKWQVNDIDFIIGDGFAHPPTTSTENIPAITTPIADITPKIKKHLGAELLPYFRLDQLVVGDSNEEAINAAKQMLAKFPKLPFNPLFIYGAVGFGKTHLLNAIGHTLQQRHSHSKILYFTAEAFLQYFVSAMKQKEIFSFENNFADVDCLLIDDLHFILGKEGALKALETIIGQFLDRGKMMVLVADRGPKDLSHLGQRILSRLLSGLATELKPLSPDMQRAILRLKAMQKNIHFNDDAILWLSEKLQEGDFSNHHHISPRAISGLVNQLTIKIELQRGANNQQTSMVVSLEKCQNLLSDFFRPERKKITIDTIQQMIANYYDITLEELLSKSRLQDIARPRQIAMYLAKKATTRSLPSIGKRFRRDHTTVIHAVRTIENRMGDNPKFQEEVIALLSRLKIENTAPIKKK
ncbi:MAG: chromosomal replication initiator protein DnaA [Alphaproteobacteria bacterium]